MRGLPILLAAVAATAMTPAAARFADEHDSHKADDAAKDKADDSDKALASAVEEAQPSRGSVTTSAGRKIDYTVTPGTLTIRNDAGEATASMFYVAYVADNLGPHDKRPVTFLFNGGPGSSSMWLHMGSWGPVRVDTPTPTAPPAAPFHIGKNPLTLLDDSDLVFVDAIGTGLSRPLGKHKGKEFWGVDPDIDSFASAIERYLTLNKRWNSPKVVYGESYGTLRAAGLVLALQKRGVQANGVVLQSSILNYGSRQPGFDIPEVRFLPSYAATAWFHNRLPNRPAALEPFLAQVRQWARGPYLAALAQGFDLPDDQRRAIAEQMHDYTGLPVPYLLASNLRVDLDSFRKELLRDRGETVGRLDSRFIGTDARVLGEEPDYDVTDTSISGPYVAAINSYLFGTLGYTTPLSYRPTFYQQIGGGPWDQTHKAPDGRTQKLAATSLDLAAAMRMNPHLKVLSLNGYYDMATPFFGAEWDLDHMPIAPALRHNITLRYYQSGHMIYIAPEAMAAMKRDLDAFYADATSEE